MALSREDEILVNDAKNSPAAFEKLYNKYADKIYNYFWYRVGHNTALAEDLMKKG